MPPVTESETARPLTEDEKKLLRGLMAREGTFATPANRSGEPYVALVNLSVPRRSNTKEDRECDLVPAGETVYLTDAEAQAFNRKGARDGRQADVVRKMSGPDGSRAQLPPRVVPNGAFLLPRFVSGRLFRPAMPPAGSDAPRPDPEGSSAIQVIEDGRAPETEGAMTPDPQEMADNLRETVQATPDAVDLPPRRTRTRGGA
jgi:hypothetical protein